MRALVILACVALSCGRPEPPSGYSYSAPSGRYSAPSSSYGAPSLGGYSGGGYSLGSHAFGGRTSNNYHGSHSSGSLSLGASHSSGGISLSSSFGDGGFGGGYAGGYSGAPLIQKHIYVHVPPPEPLEHRAPHIPEIAPPQKHYKIIFIKAPTPPAPVAPIIPPQPQNEEKTLVYVLVKKPEEQPEIVIPTPAPTQPSKPEVYFIKYQTQKDNSGGILADASLGSGLGGGSVGGAGLGGNGLSGSGLGNGGGDIAGDFGATGGDESGVDHSHTGATSSQYGPPGHTPGSLH